MAYRAVLFDLDGTLLDTIKDIADSVNIALAKLGLPQHEVEAYKYFVGDGREVLAIRALPGDCRDQLNVDRLSASIKIEYSRRWAINTLAYPGIPDMLQSIADLGIKMAILSNKPQDSTKEMVSRFLSQWRFELVFGAQSSIPMKPDPTSALQIARRLGIPPAEFLYLGDTDVDMKTAAEAGMYPIGALWGFRTADELLAGGAKGLIQYPTDLLRLL
ncbi:HAD family hydrolase [Chloroflexota bacterium]